MKKFRAKIALILVLSLTLAVAIPVLADQTTKITGKYEAPAIEVVIPTTASAVINPFGLPVQVLAEDGRTPLGYVGEDGTSLVVTRPLAGYNASLFDLDVSASVVGTPKGGLTLDGTAGAVTTKKSVINFEMKTNTYELDSDTYTWYYNAADAKTNKDKVIGQLDGALILGALNEAWSGQQTVQVGTTATSVPAITVKKGEEVEDALGRKTIEPADDGIFFARLSGEVAEEPNAVDSKGNEITTEKVKWAALDGVDVNIAWTIKLHKEAASEEAP